MILVGPLLMQRETAKVKKDKLKLERMLEDHRKLLYPNCEDGLKNLRSTLELLQWKAENGVSDKGFEKLLKMMKKMLPKDNKLPARDRKSTRLNSSHSGESRMPSSA